MWKYRARTCHEGAPKIVPVGTVGFALVTC